VGPWGWALFSIVFLWQPPHVWAIELFRAGEHAAAGLPTMPGRIGEQATRRLVLAWIAALFPVSLLPSLAGPLGPAYAAVALAVGYLFARAAVVALRRRDARADRAVFLASLVYMLLLFGAMLVELGLR